jgi:hypothetical protein
MQPNMNKNWNNDKASAFSHVFAGICSLFFFVGGGLSGVRVCFSYACADEINNAPTKQHCKKCRDNDHQKHHIFPASHCSVLPIFANCFFSVFCVSFV